MTKRHSIAARQTRMQLESPVETPDDTGGFSRTWQVVAEVWAQIEPAGMTDEFIAGHGAMSISHRVTIRWRPDITGAMRFRNGARIFEILAAQDADQRRRFMLCQCRELRS